MTIKISPESEGPSKKISVMVEYFAAGSRSDRVREVISLNISLPHGGDSAIHRTVCNEASQTGPFQTETLGG